MASLEDLLGQVEFVQLDLRVEFSDPATRLTDFVPQLRSGLLGVGEEILSADECAQLFAPPLPENSFAVQRFQRPSPPFAIHLDPATEIISILFFGQGIQLLGSFLDVFRQFLAEGLRRKGLAGQLASVEVVDGAGGRMRLAEQDYRRSPGLVPRITACWRFDRDDRDGPRQLVFLTPARLVSQGKPLFQPTLRQIFPFVLRRVTSILYAQYGVEIVDVGSLARTFTHLDDAEGALLWKDCRTLAPRGELIQLGGVVGSLSLPPALPEELLCLLRLGSLMNIGKGASWGNGSYRILSADPRIRREKE